MDALGKYTKTLVLLVLLFTGALLFSLLLTQDAPVKAAEKASVSAAGSNQDQIASRMQSLPQVGTFVYGKSGLGADLTCARILPDGNVKANILIVFELHGYEDIHPKDGQVLVDIGHSVIRQFSANRSALAGAALYVVASANPDGITNGESANGKGRCQISLGIDLNRDFPANFKVTADARNHTLSSPLSAPESRALANLFAVVKPAAVLDVHGWEDHTIGDAQVMSLFLSSTASKRQEPFDSKCGGFFSLWASTQGAKAALLELPPNTIRSPDYYAARIEDGLSQLARLVGG